MTEPPRADGRSWEAFSTTAGIAPYARDFVVVSGVDAGSYLQGQLSADVLALGDGESVLSFVLAPDGKADALLRVTAQEGGFLLDCDGGFGTSIVTRLERFKLRVKVDIEQVPRECWAVRGPRSAGCRERFEAEAIPGALVLECLWPGVVGFDLVGAVGVAAAERESDRGTMAGDPRFEPLDIAGLERCDPATLEALRIAAGMPKMGAEIVEGVIPAETGIVEEAVSFTKGCYTGQELTERIASRGGNTPRKLRHLVVDPAGSAPHAPVTPYPGTTLHKDGKQVGTVTSVAVLPPTAEVIRRFGAGAGAGERAGEGEGDGAGEGEGEGEGAEAGEGEGEGAGAGEGEGAEASAGAEAGEGGGEGAGAGHRDDYSGPVWVCLAYLARSVNPGERVAIGEAGEGPGEEGGGGAIAKVIAITVPPS